EPREPRAPRQHDVTAPAEPVAEHTREPSEAIAPMPAIPSVPPAPPAAFHAVSEHDAVAEEAHRPVRRRRHGEENAAETAASLQMVETQVPVTSAPPVEDELPRRTKPRRRRGGAQQDEPLQLVETQPGTESHADGSSAQ